MVYDRLTAHFLFRCPSRADHVRVRLSAFRTVERLPGSAHPAVYEVRFACPCGAEHSGLVTHDELDWAPISPSDERFYNVMTGRLEPAAQDLVEQSIGMIRRGSWPWCFFCFAEERPQPLFPSGLRLLAPTRERMLLAARCPACDRTSVNLVSSEHVDVPFYSDREVDVVEQIFPSDVERNLLPLADALVGRSYSTGVRRLAA
jgi:hypothetical protein